jgi:hypothetical protein
MVEIDLERGAREIGGGELDRRLREIDTVIVADLGSASPLLRHGSPSFADYHEMPHLSWTFNASSLCTYSPSFVIIRKTIMGLFVGFSRWRLEGWLGRWGG